MRDPRHRLPGRRSALLTLTALPVTCATVAMIAPNAGALPAGPPAPSSAPSLSDFIAPGHEDTQGPSPRTDRPVIDGLPEGVSVDRVEWITDRRLAIFINSAAMPGEPIQVQMLLARDWKKDPERNFPEVWALDGLRAREDNNGWTIETNIEAQFADRNVNVILPVGGESSFYADWQSPDNGKHYKWESFLIDELIPVLENGFRSTGERALTGISMGGTAAITLAEHHPELFKFVASFSGYLDTTTKGMPAAIRAAQLDAGGYHAEAMWGPEGSQAWLDHDPKLGVSKLKDIPVYVSAGSGKDDFGHPDSVATRPANAAGIGLEVISKMSTQTFVNHAKAEGVDVTTRFRPSGVHAWDYWQFEMAQAWPYIADALRLPLEDRASDCKAAGAIDQVTAGGVVGDCVTEEYAAGDNGRMQEFRGGTAYWSPESGAHVLYGKINARYAELGGAASWLGFPTSGELAAPDGVGRYARFQNGAIYWTPTTGAHAVPTEIFDAWGTQGYEAGELGYPVSEPTEANGGVIQAFENSYIVRTPSGESFWLKGEIARKYGELGHVNHAIGFPVTNEQALEGGAYQKFTDGAVYWTPNTGAHMIRYGDIFDAWGEEGWENGRFGYPVADHEDAPAGGEVVAFEHGKISQANGQISKED